MLTIEEVKNNGWLIFEAITGSKAYGLDTAVSDTDIRGVFILPKEVFYSLEYTAQVSNSTNDIVYYELRRFIELLARNNPNIIELLSVPENCILHRDAVMDGIVPEFFLSKLCEKTFGNYAITQIKKAYGLEKKIMNPLDGEKKSVLDFCFVYEQKEAILLKSWLEEKNLQQDKIGLAVISHLRDCYNLYHSESFSYSGIMRKQASNEVCLSSVPKGQEPAAMLYFNKDAYSIYCKKHKEYCDWVEKRNDERYKTTMSHGKNYDSKNMMHVFRLLLMAKEIAVEGAINVFRKDRDFLLSVKEGVFEYQELVEKAETLKNEHTALYLRSSLPAKPDLVRIDRLLIKMREIYYER